MNSKHRVKNLLDFIDVSPSPWHAVNTIQKKLLDREFVRLNEQERWHLNQGGRYYVIRDDSSIILFVMGQKPLVETGFKIIGAHTDSPGLRLKPNPVMAVDNFVRIGVEVYGGPILATFTDRDLSLAGRISYRSEQGISTKLVDFTRPLLRLPNLAIHMNRTVNEDGLKLNKQLELPLIFSLVKDQITPQQQFLTTLAEQAEVDAAAILSWELNVYDTQKGAFWGAEDEFYADSQLDNLASCHAGLTALLDDQVLKADSTLVCAFFDHEEIGSTTSKGADGSFLSDILQRIGMAGDECKGEQYQRALASSFMISADMAHAYQPNFPMAYEPDHKVLVNHGPVIKVNANHRYATNSVSEALFASWCDAVNVRYQKYAHRTDLPCGSTIGPLTSARLGINTVDVGNPMWAMHSLRESAGVEDHAAMIEVMKWFFLH
ncbi:MAG: M18 family aminopeptidase [Methylicorpusculum sp.]|uniref:M18 family aminopeptidase n=1 Tax=Methylicorpusculum sp. TaxID=2713644 RepID=UPI00271673D7|nr:M18 family aminopeptidase [Methylicorpusculum sp.]MDO8938896.1 M18 family aminopeptidase [Methylicorpusculum sp.]MDO9239258.1 M18 family aminopeptidase [Methylicorpusculum sp.]MDP2204653.1 M18 family aminopeptidase [Methylicorpusculum sp.]